MMLKLKIYSTVFVLYEILAVLLLHCPRTCTAMFGNTFCSDSIFKYFIALLAIPALASLIVMWVMHIIHAIRRRNSFLFRAQEAVEDVATSIKKTLKESVSGKDIEKYIIAALAMGVKKYSDKNPELKKTFGNIIDAVTGHAKQYMDTDSDDDDSEEETRRPAPRRVKGKSGGAKRSR